MNLIKTAEDLIKFKTETGNLQEIEKCMEYCKGLFKNSPAIVEIYHYDNASPVLFVRNKDVEDFDVIVLGHLDVVPAPDDMFIPKIENGKLFGRGALDMKTFAAVAFNSMQYVLENNLDINFGIILSSDEEKGSDSTHAFMASHPQISAKIVLDSDVGGDIQKIITKCKNPVYAKITAKGEAAHGSTPWEGVDANELLMKTCANIRKIYPYYSKELPEPTEKWQDTLHFASIKGGEVMNIISNHAEALCDFRLVETTSVADLCNNLDKCMEKGVTYEIIAQSIPVVMSETNPYILDYKNFAENILGKPIEFEQIGGATDSRSFAVKGSTIIMHSGTGEGMHSIGEYVEIDSVEKLADIQIKFLQLLSDKK